MKEENTLEKRKTTFPTIGQSEFKKYLPALLSKEVDVVGRRKWLEICVDPRLSVNVVDDVTGEVIHRVPPISYTTTELTGKNVNGIVEEWSKRSDISPFHGNLFIEQNLDPNIVLGEPPEEDVLLWIDIMKRYGYMDGKKEDDSKSLNEVLEDDPNSW